MKSQVRCRDDQVVNVLGNRDGEPRLLHQA